MAEAPSFKALALASRVKAATAASGVDGAFTAGSRSAGRAGAYTPGQKTPAPTTGVVGIAASLSGIPYVWGGTTKAGFDCSGYVQYVFRQAGKNLPRTAQGQRAATTPVSNPQPGDLVFFGTWHVGIYAGNGMMYDAPTAGQTTGLHKIWSNQVSYGRVA